MKKTIKELLRLGYTECSMKFYRNRWQKILQFAEENNETHYSEQLGINYVENHFQIYKKNFDQTLSQKDTQELCIIQMIGDFQLHHKALMRCYKHQEFLKDQYYIIISNDFSKYCESKDYSKVAVDHYVKQSKRFIDYLVSQEIYDYQNITLPIVNSYINTLARYTYTTVEQNICSIRAFLRYLL
ncbi:hypothetical protein [Proteiniborus sp. MB09-C3]|uniref:hypothetical protein n=1 Tax=Proteiniborus sp. MB09-C3 TaxID=3050072 RepID=UPI0025528A9C|nr:hypothetical protein [Proteiniborus sp. MB09-C3]WIV11329.1 hypothetical protein QO263_14385 [Proteiniborus sp. MB09-C3]